MDSGAFLESFNTSASKAFRASGSVTHSRAIIASIPAAPNSGKAAHAFSRNFSSATSCNDKHPARNQVAHMM